MKILLTNDDGIRALGIWALAVALAKRHEVIIVAICHMLNRNLKLC